jgi:hypothetical protein
LINYWVSDPHYLGIFPVREAPFFAFQNLRPNLKLTRESVKQMADDARQRIAEMPWIARKELFGTQISRLFSFTPYIQNSKELKEVQSSVAYPHLFWQRLADSDLPFQLESSWILANEAQIKDLFQSDEVFNALINRTELGLSKSGVKPPPRRLCARRGM